MRKLPPEEKARRQKEQQKNNYAKHKEARKAWMKAYRERNRGLILQSYKDNREKRVAGVLRSREKNKPRYLAYMKEYGKAYRKNNPPDRRRQREYSAQWYQRNRERRLAQCKRYQESHRPMYRILRGRRRVAMQCSKDEIKRIRDWAKRLASKTWIRCYWCGIKVRFSECHIDHIVPVSKGGKHSSDNLCAACSPCNLKKHAKLVQDWERTGQQMLPV